MSEEKYPIEFEKDGVTKQAQNPAEKVDLQFHGWTRVERKHTAEKPSADKSSSK